LSTSSTASKPHRHPMKPSSGNGGAAVSSSSSGG
jgi:hypothetical protein